MNLNDTEFNQARAEIYVYAMRRSPHARDSELANLELNLLDPHRILELGSGEGYLTKYLSSKFSNSEIYAVDASRFMLSQISSLQNVTNLRQDGICLPSDVGLVDLVITLANFHHIKRKEQFFSDASKVLSKNGYLIIADVSDQTPVQRFFDDVVREYCITGHNLLFTDQEEIRKLSESFGMKVEKSEIRETPWEFGSEEEMLIFVKHLFGLDISYRQLKEKVNQHFSVVSNVLPWQLGYHYIKNEN